jgi:hypothetical protein
VGLAKYLEELNEQMIDNAAHIGPETTSEVIRKVRAAPVTRAPKLPRAPNKIEKLRSELARARTKMRKLEEENLNLRKALAMEKKHVDQLRRDRILSVRSQRP